MPRAVLALPCGSRSMTRTVLPAWASAAATLTVVVVLPTPPFWLATVITRVCAGRGTVRPLSVIRFRASAATAAARGVRASAPGIAAAISARSSVSSATGEAVADPSVVGPEGDPGADGPACSGAGVFMRSSRGPAAGSGVGAAGVGTVGTADVAGAAGSAVVAASGVAAPAVGASSVRAAVAVPTSGTWVPLGAAELDVSRETVSGPGHPSGVVSGPDNRGKPRPGAAVRVSATSIAELTPSPSSWGAGACQSNPTSGQHAKAPRPPVENAAPNGALWTTRRHAGCSLPLRGARFT